MQSVMKILSFDKLKEYAGESSEGLQRQITRFSRRAKDKTPKPPTLWERIYPKAEVLRLRAFIEAMRAEEHMAAKNALDLYAENESLRLYKDLADGHMYQFVPADDHKALKKEYEQIKEKLSRVSYELDALQREWTESIKDFPKRQKPGTI